MADRMAFFTTPRRPRERRAPQERLGDWHEVYREGALLPVVGSQAARCMDCGLPFCHHACPLGNVIPDWNTLVAHQDWGAAASRLLATNNFPEFTGRLCPAPCESACVLAIDGEAVTIKNVELAIADRAWEDGYDRPQPPERMTGLRVAVVGSGPAGLAAAQQLTRAGHTTTVYERADRIGGLLRYGIPPFRLEKHRLDRRIGQMAAEGTRFRTRVAVGRDVSADALRARHDAMVVAVGARACRDLPVAGRRLPGVYQAITYLTLANRVDEGDCPASPVSAEGRSVVIVGGGDTAADCLGTALRQRAAAVTQFDINPRPPDRRAPGQPWPVHPKVYRVTTSHEEAGGSAAEPRVFAAVTVGFEAGADGRLAAVRFAEARPGDRSPRPGTERTVPAELALLALGFNGPGRRSGLARQLGLAADRQGRLVRDEGFAAGADGVFVAGDAGRGQSLIVWAVAEGRAVAAAVDGYLRGGTDLPAPVAPSDGPLTV
ncbi:glutamate synthase subunit beta [Streptomyces sp. CB01881]|uniref:glutamate synthase subunit beta n=1 Tax=Streptomyces sp. CB01881 TaxID=2078691 RepID=UPI000CDBF1D6|nr:glutamate synthase subunit beta [Streptomyces sp. CB01881]AUY47822.1 glutamate synthase [Streptomyces sp. CB01881]TYC77747.1 glutamate synthase subunit beta [Streptomyces sp. CB01881]